jgi:hypothetical protein
VSCASPPPPFRPPYSLPPPTISRLRQQLRTPLVSIVVYLGDSGGPTLVLAQVRCTLLMSLHVHDACCMCMRAVCAHTASAAAQVPGAPRNGPRRAWRIWPHAGQARRGTLGHGREGRMGPWDGRAMGRWDDGTIGR